jgi:hypothetical protein
MNSEKKLIAQLGSLDNAEMLALADEMLAAPIAQGYMYGPLRLKLYQNYFQSDDLDTFIQAEILTRWVSEQRLKHG